MTMPTLLFAAVVVGLFGNAIAGGEYCMYNKFYFILLSFSNLTNLLKVLINLADYFHLFVF